MKEGAAGGVCSVNGEQIRKVKCLSLKCSIRDINASEGASMCGGPPFTAGMERGSLGAEDGGGL